MNVQLVGTGNPVRRVHAPTVPRDETSVTSPSRTEASAIVLSLRCSPRVCVTPCGLARAAGMAACSAEFLSLLMLAIAAPTNSRYHTNTN